MLRIKNPNPSRLPSEYQEVEYIESTGTQYIDTGVNGTAIGTYEIKFNPLDTKARDFEQYFAGDKDFPTTSKLYVNSSVVEQGRDGKDTVLFSLGNVAHTVSVTDTAILVDDVIVEYYTPGAWGTLTYYIFNSHGEPNLMSSMRLYYLKMYSDGILVRDYIPCYRKSDNVAGLYDLVNSTFYTNIGTGTFLVGSDVAKKDLNYTPVVTIENPNPTEPLKLPSEYQEVEYIESTGTQYINSGYTPNLNNYTRVKANVAYTAPADRQMLCGFDYGHGFLFGYLNASNYFLNYMGNHSSSSVRATANQFYEIEQTYKNGSQVLIIDGNSVLTTSLTFSWASYPMYIFARHTSSGPDALSKLKLRYLQIYDNDVLVRDYVPCYRKSDNVAGLYDLVNNTFYQNVGTGTFAIGNVIRSSAILEYPLIREYVGDKLVYGKAPSEQIINYTMLYDNGDECTDITGGWTIISDTNGSVTKNTSNIYLKSYRAMAHTKLKINLAEYRSFGMFNTYMRGRTTTAYNSQYVIYSPSGEYENGTNSAVFKEFAKAGWGTSYSLNRTNNCANSAGYSNLYNTFSVDTENYIGIISDDSAKQAFIQMTNFTLFKEDDWQTLASIAGITASSIDALLANSTNLLSNEDAVEFMIYNCTGTFMAKAIQSSTFLTALNNSSYNTTIQANEHWNKFLTMVV